MSDKHLGCAIATDTGAFGLRWWLCNDSGKWSTVTERYGRTDFRTRPFPSEQEAREYFTKYTTKYVEQTA